MAVETHRSVGTVGTAIGSIAAKRSSSGPPKHLGRRRDRVGETDIDDHVLERSPIECDGDVVPHRRAFECRVRLSVRSMAKVK